MELYLGDNGRGRGGIALLGGAVGEEAEDLGYAFEGAEAFGFGTADEDGRGDDDAVNFCAAAVAPEAVFGLGGYVGVVSEILEAFGGVFSVLWLTIATYQWRSVTPPASPTSSDIVAPRESNVLVFTCMNPFQGDFRGGSEVFEGAKLAFFREIVKNLRDFNKGHGLLPLSLIKNPR